MHLGFLGVREGSVMIRIERRQYSNQHNLGDESRLSIRGKDQVRRWIDSIQYMMGMGQCTAQASTCKTNPRPIIVENAILAVVGSGFPCFWVLGVYRILGPSSTKKAPYNVVDIAGYDGEH
jgi:hypothetical protein